MVSRNALRVLIIGLTAATVAACSSSGPQVSFKQRSKEYFSERHYGPASPRVVNYGPVPKGGGHVVVGDAYRVAGMTYIPRDNPRYSATGLASWYGEAFHGRLTANGEVYDVNGMTAAHPTMPLPSYARVTNLQNGRSMIVRVNDRGPFAHDRIIDLSSRVADMLDMKDQGTARVQVDYVGRRGWMASTSACCSPPIRAHPALPAIRCLRGRSRRGWRRRSCSPPRPRARASDRTSPSILREPPRFRIHWC